MNNQTKTQENVKKALTKQTLGLPLTPHEHALVTLYGQSPVQQKENKPEFVEKYLKPLVVALGVGVVNVVYRKTSEHDEIVTLIYQYHYNTDTISNSPWDIYLNLYHFHAIESSGQLLPLSSILSALRLS